MAYYEGNISDLSTGCNNNNGWNDWSWIIGLALVGGLFGGWGNGGFGFGGNRGGYAGGIAENYTLATDFANIERKIDGVNNGLCDGFYAQNTNTLNGFASVQSALCQGFSGVNSTIVNNGYETRDAINTGFAGVNNALCTLGYQNQAGFNQINNSIQSCCCDISRQISDCCCDIKTMNLENRYLNEKQTSDLIINQNANTRAILDFLTGEKIAGLQAENAGLKAQISNDRQSAYLLSELKECPRAAYIVPNPNCCYNYNVTGFGYNNGCCGASVQ